MLGYAPSSSSCPSVGLIVPRKVAGVGWGDGKDMTPTEPAKSEIQGQGLQVHLPEAFSCFGKSQPRILRLKNTKKSVKAVTSGPGSHKDRSPWQASSSSLSPSILPWLLSSHNRGPGKSLVIWVKLSSYFSWCHKMAGEAKGYCPWPAMSMLLS